MTSDNAALAIEAVVDSAWISQSLAFISSIVSVAFARVASSVIRYNTVGILRASILEASINIVFVELASLSNEVVAAFASISVVGINTLAAVLTWIFSHTGIMFADNGVDIFKEVVDIGVNSWILGKSTADTE